MNNTTFSFNEKQIVQSVVEPDTRSLWLNSNDNKLYKFGNSGWEPVGGTNIYRIFLAQYDRPDMLILDPNHEKENTLARIAFDEDLFKYTNNIYLITYKDDIYGEMTGIANCYNQDIIIADFTVGLNLVPQENKMLIYKDIVLIDSELFRYRVDTPNEEVIFRISRVKIQADIIV